MAPTRDAVERLRGMLRLETPLIAIYDAAPGAPFEPLVTARGRTCCFAYYPQWLKGTTVVYEKGNAEFLHPDCGCPGAQRAFGLAREYPSFMANFLSDGVGAPSGEGLKASAALAQEFLDHARPVEPSGATVLLGPVRLEQWDAVRSVTFFVDPDRLSGVLTLAGYWSSDNDLVAAPFSSGCGLMWRSLGEYGRDRPVIGCTDLAMRKYLPREILSLSVTPARFEQMAGVPGGSFLERGWWNELMDARVRRAPGQAGD